MKRILIESGHERNRNAGDEAYFATMVELFRNYLGEISITAFSDRPERDRERYGVETVYSGGSLFKTIRSSIKILRAIKACDVYVWGAGQILRDDTGLKSPLYRLSRPFLAKIMGKRVMAYAAGIGPLETPITRFLAKKVLNAFDLITIRDEFSKDLLKNIGVSKPDINLTVDPAFALQPSSSQQLTSFLESIGIEEETALVGVAPFGPAFRGVRSLLPAKYQVKLGLWKPGGEEKYHKHIGMLAEFLDYVIEKYDVKLIFIAQDASWQGLDDRITGDIISTMKKQGSVISLNADDYPPSVIKAMMGKMEVLIGGRMHSLILASGTGTPVLGTCFEQKIKSFGGIIQQQEYFLEVDGGLNFGNLLTTFDRLWLNRQTVREKLEPRMEQLKLIVESNVLSLGSLLRMS